MAFDRHQVEKARVEFKVQISTLPSVVLKSKAVVTELERKKGYVTMLVRSVEDLLLLNTEEDVYGKLNVEPYSCRCQNKSDNKYNSAGKCGVCGLTFKNIQDEKERYEVRSPRREHVPLQPSSAGSA